MDLSKHGINPEVTKYDKSVLVKTLNFSMEKKRKNDLHKLKGKQ